ncbi:hypothetical protein CVT26_002873 [Gymnopilus dilepis]|uniref:F-box domain-containing protein n=1 Tax=Gymnopilus dilepis TaxID=231916 RepID=A0A409VT96_9AGAR|nr:hypothetical protein CVT26_002873 [Gymnopilus dilepis]
MDVKWAIKELELKPDFRDFDNCDIIFAFLQSLPSLQSFSYSQICRRPITPARLPQLLSSLQHLPLIKFSLKTGTFERLQGPVIEGLRGLQALSITWTLGDHPDQPGSSHEQLMKLIRPSLASLVDLCIKNEPSKLDSHFDLWSIKDAGTTLTSFEYALQSLDDSILDTIPTIFPNLTKLSISWNNLATGYSLPWQDAHAKILSRNTNLIELKLSSDFEKNSNDPVTADTDYAWYVRSYKRRLEASQIVAQVCTKLQRCSWLQWRIGRVKNSSMLHPFVIEEQTLHGNVVRRARGVKQYWMGRDQEDEWREGIIVKCRLEDLPGDIIGEND